MSPTQHQLNPLHTAKQKKRIRGLQRTWGPRTSQRLLINPEEVSELPSPMHKIFYFS
jgi:hypothetical protein